MSLQPGKATGMMMEPPSSSDNISVAIRVRQLIQKELAGGLKSYWNVSNNTISCDEPDSSGRKINPYSFDRVFDDTTITMDIWEDVCKPIVDAALGGFNGTIFAYGQSSSGKTFTMLGSKVQPGIITLAIEEIFSAIENVPEREFLIRVGYMEIYNERVSDLLGSNDSVLKLQEDTDHNIQVVGLTEEILTDARSVMEVLQKGNAKRHTAETKQNDRSSRSHCILRIVIESRAVGREDDAVNVSNLYFVDLAGSEKAGDNSGDRFREGCAINKSLFTLGMVIRKLTGDTSQQHVSFRDSKLTRILKNALGGNSKTAIIATITPAHIDESDSTLKFASRAKNICNKATVNEVMSEAAMLKRYRSQIKKLEMQIKEMNDTDVILEKAELERRLQDKERAEKEQADMIDKLRTMIVPSGMAAPLNEPPKKKRRETWCPGKAGMMMAALPQFSPPRPLVHKKASPESSRNQPTKKKPSLEMEKVMAEMDQTVFGEEFPGAAFPGGTGAGTGTSPGSDTAADFTINQNPAVKELFELQDKHELVLEELQKKGEELEELQTFTQMERECEADTIKELKEKISTLESSLPWLEEELLKTQQERNNLRQKVETMNRRLTAVEDGTGIAAKSKELSDTQTVNAELNSELDVQKSRYEFHIEQMRKKLETYTLLLEEKGVDPDELKKRLSESDIELESSGRKSGVDSKRLEIDELRNEVDMLVIGSEKDKKKMEEMTGQFESELEEMKTRFHKDLDEARDEIEIYQQLLQEEKAKFESANAQTNAAEGKTDLDEIRDRYEAQIQDLKSHIEELTNRENDDKHDSADNTVDANKSILSQGTPVKAQPEEAATDVPKSAKKRHSRHVNFNIGSEVEIQKELYSEKLQDVTNERDNVISTLEQVQARHEEEMVVKQAELDKYLELYQEVKQQLQAAIKDNSKQTETQDTAGNKTTDSGELHQESQVKLDEEIETSTLQNQADIDTDKEQSSEICSKEAEMADESLLQQISDLKEKHALEVEQMKAEFAKFVEDNFLNADKKQNDSDNMDHPTRDAGEDEANLKYEMLLTELNEQREKHTQEVETLKAELSSYKASQEKDRAETTESVENSELRNEILVTEMTEMKEKHAREVSEMEEELTSYRMVLEEEKSKKNDCSGNSDLQYEMHITELNELKEKHSEQVKALKDELLSYKTSLEQERAEHNESAVDSNLNNAIHVAEMNEMKESHLKEVENMEKELASYRIMLEEERANRDHNSQNSDVQYELHLTELNELKEKHTQYIEALKAELSSYKNLQEQDRTNTNNVGESDMKNEILMAEMNELKDKHAKEVKDMEEELASYKSVLEEERSKKNDGLGDSDLRFEILRAELNEQKDKHSKEVEALEEQLSAYKTLLEQHSEPNSNVEDADLQKELLVAEMNELKDKHSKEVKEMEEELASYRSVMEEEKSKKSISSEDSDLRYEMLRAELNAQKDTHLKEVESLEDQVSSYKALLEQDSKPNDHVEDSDLQTELLVVEMNELKNKHTKEVEALEEQLSAYKTLLEQQPEPNSNVEDADLQKELLMAEVNELKDKHALEMKEMEEKLASYRSVFEEENPKKTDCTGDSDLRYEMLRSELNEQREKHSKEVEVLEDELSSLKLLLEEERAKTTSEHCELDNENFHKEIQDTRAKYEKEIANLKEELERHQTAYTEEMCNSSQNMVQEELSALKEMHACEIEALNDDLAAYKEVLDEMEMKASANVQTTEEKREVESSSTASVQVETREAAQQTDEAPTTSSSLDVQCVIEETQRELHTMREQIELLSKEIYNLQAANTKLKAEKLDLINARDTIQQSLDQLEEELRDVRGDVKLQEENALLQSRIADLEEYIKLGEAMLATKAEEIDDLKQSLDEHGTAGEEADKRAAELREQCASLEDRMAATGDELQLQNEKIVEFELSESQFSGKVMSLESELETAKESENTLTKLCSEYEEKIVSLETDRELVNAKHQELQDDNSSLTKEVDRLRLDLELAQSKDTELKDIQETYQGKIADLEQALTEAQTHATKMENLKSELNDKLVVLEGELERVNSKVGDIEEDKRKMEGLREELEWASGQVKLLEGVIDKGKTQLEETLASLQDTERNQKDALELVKDLENRLEIVEKEKETLKTEMEEISTNAKNTKEISEENTYLKARVEDLQKDGLLSDELISEYETKLRETNTRLAALKDDAAKVEEKVKQELEGRLADLEEQRSILQNKLDHNKAESELRLQGVERERDDVRAEMATLKRDLDERLTALEEENKKAKEELAPLSRERDSLQDEVSMLQRDKAPVVININPESDSEWERRWTEFTREEKTKRLGLIVEIRALKRSVKYEQQQRQAAKEEALEELLQTGKNKEVLDDLEEKYRKADDDANRLNDELGDERKLTAELRERLEKLEAQLQQGPATSKKGGFVSSADHHCDYRLESVRVAQELKEAKWELDRKLKSHAEVIQHYDDRQAKMKNEMRRLQTNMDNTVCMNPRLQQPNLSDSSLQQQQSDNGPRSANIVGSSSGGGIVDHFRVCYTEAENKRLQKELSQLKKQLGKTEELDKENRDLKKDLRGVKAELKKFKTDGPAKSKDESLVSVANCSTLSTSSTSSRPSSMSELPLAEMIQKATAPSPQRPVSDIIRQARNNAAATSNPSGLLSAQKKSTLASTTRKPSSNDEANNCKTQ